MEMDKVVKGMEQFRADLKPFCGNHEDWKRFDDALILLKEQEEKPLRCDKCSYHREDGWCGMHRRWVNETDYCSFGAWKGR